MLCVHVESVNPFRVRTNALDVRIIPHNRLCVNTDKRMHPGIIVDREQIQQVTFYITNLPLIRTTCSQIVASIYRTIFELYFHRHLQNNMTSK